MTARSSCNHSPRLLDELRRANPRRLLEWPGFRIDGVWMHPYSGYVRAAAARRPRDVLLAELLVGDVVGEALLLGLQEAR